MLTVFTTAKAFTGRFKTIQRNAIRSWTMLRPRPEIILLGDDPGTAETAREFGLRHEGHLETTEFGTPLVDALFRRAEQVAGNDLLCDVNADIILMRDFMDAVQTTARLLEGKQFLMIGRKTNVPIPEELCFEAPEWETRLKERALSQGIHGTSDTDYFLFRRGLWPEIPPFAIGRYFWSLWLVYAARKKAIPVIDATAVILAVESTHDYSHAKSIGFRPGQAGAEVRKNAELFRGSKLYTTVDATHVLTADGLHPRPANYAIKSAWIRTERRLAYWAKEECYPYSAPFLYLYRAVRPIWNALSRSTRQG